VEPGESRVRVDWAAGRWSHAPAAVVADGESLLVTAVEGSDAWRDTSYGFVHDSEHALLAPLPTDRAVEVAFEADYDQQFDQAGVFLRASETTWVKAGVECADGVLQVGAVVTAPKSDWSVAPVPEWHGRPVTIRVSRSGGALTIRARVDDEPLRLVRVVPLAPELAVEAGPFTCAPTRAGLTVRFLSWEVGPADAALH
jgi:regulation of enolase protein 1 (concanavalin A-like superfamily)